MPSFSQVMLIGHLGSEPEMRFTPNGNPVTNFSVATSRRYTNSYGESVEDTQWWRVTAWGRLAEACNEYLAKGSLVFVLGEPKLHTWERQDGSAGASLEVTARQVKFLTRRVEAGVVEAVESEPELEDIPF